MTQHTVAKKGLATKIKRWIFRCVLAILILAVLPLTPIFGSLVAMSLTGISQLFLKTPNHASTIVVLGGGLTKDIKDSSMITLNHYSRSRADQALKVHRLTKLPIITSGVESPWLQEYLKQHQDKLIVISDNASMNTCENAIFTAKLLSYHELPNRVYLVTDRYHMARARRQFAKAGVESVIVPAPLDVKPSWMHPKDNLVHSRRAVYEVLALLRDTIKPQSDCRAADRVSIEEISTPRRELKLFTPNIISGSF